MIIVLISSIKGSWSQTGNNMFVAIVLSQPWTLFVVSVIRIGLKLTGVVKMNRNQKKSEDDKQQEQSQEDGKQEDETSQKAKDIDKSEDLHNEQSKHQDSKEPFGNSINDPQTHRSLIEDSKDVQNEDLSNEPRRVSEIICSVDDKMSQDLQVFPKEPNSYCLDPFKSGVASGEN